ncbi:energy-coupling factor transporter ATPase [uncultured Anaerococcus sp.]|uniref:energy-coupling factor transporter ATPase n=1 Tax=uncultured Anaerococcus sp. TaxID=293428 RepID=UPI002805C943|nr:energy-coupling factor transporter ATPase [uncultured Anaerococcus sp.]
MKIELKNVDYIYNAGLPSEVYALKDINLEINSHEIVGLIGQTGSGKSTLVQLLNGLLIPTNGDCIIDGINSKDKKKRKDARFKVGLVFQYPENQLFEETIAKDIAFGPKNMGLREEEIDKRVRVAMAKVGLDYETYKDKSPFELSGGQQRRVAVAGILSMNPKVLVLDELTAGLDPVGRDEIFEEIISLYKADPELSIVLVSHSMEDVAEYVDRVIVMNKGEVYSDKSTYDTFTQAELSSIGLDVPQITKFMRAYKEKNPAVRDDIYTVDAAISELKRVLGGKDGKH